MNEKRIAVIAGDDNRPEEVNEGIKVMDKMAALDRTIKFEYNYLPWGCEYYLKHGKMMDDDGIDQLASFDEIYLGAEGYPGVPDSVSLRDLLIVIRSEFDQY